MVSVEKNHVVDDEPGDRPPGSLSDRSWERILVVDDESSMHRVYNRTFMDTPYELRFASNGREAVEAAKTFRPHIVLLDIMMPEVDGYQVCEALMTDDATRSAEVIFISAKGEVRDRIQGYQAGAVDFLPKPFDPDELVLKVSARLGRMRTYESALLTDALTRVGNRRLFEERLDKMLKAAVDSGDSFSLAMVDIDHFKRINDAYGHAGGDCVLQILAERMRFAVRRSDIVGRFGGEEFAILMEGAQKSGAIASMERLRSRVLTPIRDERISERLIRVSVSIGVATCPEDGADRQTLIQKADAALYEAKRNGRNRVQPFVDDSERSG